MNERTRPIRTRLAEFAHVDLRPALAPWLLARVIVVLCLAVARYVFDEIGSGPRPPSLDDGLFAWDGWHYRRIAEVGYDDLPDSSLRFFPLFPMLGRALGIALTDRAAGVLVVANASALLAAGLLHCLVRRETGDVVLADRAVWLLALLPHMFVLVLGYSEATFLVLSIGAFLAVRSRRWYCAALLGAAAGATRPFGVVLMLPIAIEATRGWQRTYGAGRVARAVATIAPAAGLGVFLAWSAVARDDAFLPLRVQNDDQLRGGWADPFSNLLDSARELAKGEHLGAGLHVLWAPVVVILVVAAARRLPAAYSAYAGASVVLALLGDNLSSLERYSFGAFPVVIGAAALTRWGTDRSDAVWPGTVAVSVALLSSYTVLVFLYRIVP